MTPLLALFDAAEKLGAAGKYDVFFGYNSRDKQFAISWSLHPYEYGSSQDACFRHVRLNDTGTIHAIRAKLEKLLEEKR